MPRILNCGPTTDSACVSTQPRRNCHRLLVISWGGSHVLALQAHLRTNSSHGWLTGYWDKTAQNWRIPANHVLSTLFEHADRRNIPAMRLCYQPQPSRLSSSLSSQPTPDPSTVPCQSPTHKIQLFHERWPSKILKPFRKRTTNKPRLKFAVT